MPRPRAIVHRLYSDLPCPMCGHSLSRVLDTRGNTAGFVRRRRLCSCTHRFTTHEILADEHERLKARVCELEALFNRIKILGVDLKAS